MKKIIGIILVVAVVAAVFTGIFNKSETTYEKANEKTNALTNYGMKMSTTVTLQKDGEELQSTVEQMINVNDKDKKDMRYQVETKVATVENKNSVVGEENSYMYHDNFYYYTYPGLKYKSATTHDAAYRNITNLTNVIAFERDKMHNVTTTEHDDEIHYDYGVDYADVSDHVKSLLENTSNIYENKTFKLQNVSATAVVKDGYVKSRTFFVTYKADDLNLFTIEIDTEMIFTKEKIEKPKDDEFPAL